MGFLSSAFKIGKVGLGLIPGGNVVSSAINIADDLFDQDAIVNRFSPKTKGVPVAAARNFYAPPTTSSSAQAEFGQMIPEGRDVDIVSGKDVELVPDGKGGMHYREKRRRRRRRRLLTTSDKADIAFIVGQLGTGQIGRAAISAMLSRRC